MKNSSVPTIAALLVLALAAMMPAIAAPPQSAETHFLPRAGLGKQFFGNDAPWYESNIPFFDCSDSEIEQIYYYRWKVYKSHLKDLGDHGYIVTEFLDDVSWALQPYQSLNDATGFHLGEGRWLRDQRYIDDYITFLYSFANDRHFSEAIADATYRTYLVSHDPTTALASRDAMIRIYQQWDDHKDSTKGLYFIEPLLDATEYTISSIDASGGKDGFGGGDAFRPTINSFMYANAIAISKLSTLAGDKATAADYATKASTLRDLTQKYLWNTDFQHFTDRFKVDNKFVHYWDFVRGRELAGYTPWYFELPDITPEYVASWSHLLSPVELGGAYGVRTVEPSYEYYMRQYRYAKEGGIDKRECQWNGPSWPFQTTLALGGMANLLNDYPAQSTVTRDDYLRLLRQYTKQHYQNGAPDLQEDYDADTGQVIVGLHRSHHYNHSGYDDLVISGLVGLRPRADDVLEVNPLVPTDPKSPQAIRYFCLENVPYHGHAVTILFDQDGKRYKKGVGLSVYVDGVQVAKPSPLGKKTVRLAPSAPMPPASVPPVNLAVNMSGYGFPAPSASVNNAKYELRQAVDGRVWYYPNVRNYWTNAGSQNSTDWFAVDLGQPQTVRSARLYFYADGKQYKAPTSATIQYWTGTDWANVKDARSVPAKVLENGETVVTFAPVETAKLRVVFPTPKNAAMALVEMKAFGDRVYIPTDEFHPGDPVSEMAHHFEGTNSQSGRFQNIPWRDATNGGSFAFDLKTTPNAPHDLIVRYWGGDKGNRDFTVLVDGTPIAEESLNNSQPGQFRERAYPLPSSLIQNKKTIRITFQAKLGATAGGVFGATLVSRKL